MPASHSGCATRHLFLAWNNKPKSVDLPGVEDTPYYYSRDGSDVNGPVTEEALRQLLQDNVIDATCYFCREGDTEWQQISMEIFALEAAAPSFELPASPEPTAAEAPPSPGNERLEGWWSAMVDIMESPSIRVIFHGICILVPVLLGFILTSHYAHSLPPTEHTEDHMVPLTGCFFGVIAAAALIVYLIGLPCPPAYRLWARTGAMLLLSLPVIFGPF